MTALDSTPRYGNGNGSNNRRGSDDAAGKGPSMSAQITREHQSWYSLTTVVAFCVVIISLILFQAWLEGYWSWGVVLRGLIAGSIGWGIGAATSRAIRAWQQERKR